MKDIRFEKHPKYENLGTDKSPLFRYYFNREFIPETNKFKAHYKADYLPESGGDINKPNLCNLEKLLRETNLETREILNIMRLWQKS